MEVLLALNGTLKSSPETEDNPPFVERDDTNGELAFDYCWMVDCKPAVVLKDAVSEVDMKSVKEIENTQGNVQLEMTVIMYPDDSDEENRRGKSFASMFIRDLEGVIQRVLNFCPLKAFEMFVEIKYLERVLTFSGFQFNYGIGEQVEDKWYPISSYRLLELLSDDIVRDGIQFTGTIAIQFARL